MSKLSTLKQEAYQAGKKRNWAQAIVLYEQILELDKNNPTVINELGDLCLKGDEIQRAVRHFLSAAAKYRTTGLLNNAVAIYKKILRHESANLNAHWYLAETRANQGLMVEGESHAIQFLEGSENVSGDIKEIYLKRCQGLFDLFPASRVILSRLSQIFRVWSMPLEATRADCLLACMDFVDGKEAEARKAIGTLTAKLPEVMNYPEFAKWNKLVNPVQPTKTTFGGFGEVSLDDGPHAAATVAKAPAAAFGDLNMGGPTGAVADDPVADEPAAPAVELPAPEADEPFFADVASDVSEPSAVPEASPYTSPVAKELDDDGCFSIGDEEVGSDFDELIAQASSGMQHPEPAAEALSESPVAAAAPKTPDAEGKVDLLAQMLESDGPDLAAGACGELATITEQIGLVVGGGEADQADRLYEMGTVYLEMGMYNQACDSFEAAAADAEYSARAHEMWGITLQRAQRPDEAIAVLARGLANVPAGSREQHGLLYHLGLAMEKTGQDDEAIECFRTINDMDPAYMDVGRRLAKLTSV